MCDLGPAFHLGQQRRGNHKKPGGASTARERATGHFYEGTMNRYQTQTEPPITLKCLVCGGDLFDVKIKRVLEAPDLCPVHTLHIRYDYNRYICHSCGFIMNFDTSKSLLRLP